MWRACSLVLLMACDGTDCAEGCRQARKATAACLQERELDWSARGWADAADHEAWCATWVWEAGRLEAGGADAACAEATDLDSRPCDAVLRWPEPLR